MNFGNFGLFELGFVLVVWGIPLTCLVWFVRTLSAMAASLRDVSNRLATLEREFRDDATHRTT